MKELFENMILEACKDVFVACINTPSSNYLCFIPLELKDEIKKLKTNQIHEFLLRSDYVLENGKLIKSKEPSLRSFEEYEERHRYEKQ